MWRIITRNIIRKFKLHTEQIRQMPATQEEFSLLARLELKFPRFENIWIHMVNYLAPMLIDINWNF